MFKRRYYQLTKSWYAAHSLAGRDFTEELMFGLYNDEGEAEHEIAMRWYNMGKGSAARLEIFDDQFATLHEFSDLFRYLSLLDESKLTPERFIQMLEYCGFENDTKTDYDS